MNTEQLKLIIETINGLGGQGKEAFIWWLVLDKGLHFVLVGAAIGLLFIATMRAFRYIYNCNKPNHGTPLENAFSAVTHWWLSTHGEAGEKAYAIREQLEQIIGKKK